MKYKILKTATLSLSAILILLMSGCVKKVDTFTDFSTTSDFVLLTVGQGGSNSVNVPFNRGSDLNKIITADLASANNTSGAVKVTIAVNPAAIATYNTTNGTNYVALPTANYKLNATTLTIPAGQHYAETSLDLINLGSLDPAVSYMVAVSITDASGKKLSSNLNTLYFYTIGNPLAGVYNWFGQRFNEPLDTTQVGASGYSVPANNISQAISPFGPTSLFFPVVYLSQNASPSGTKLDFTNNAGVLSNFTASLYNAGDFPGSFIIITGPVLVGYQIVGTAATKYVGSVFRFYTVVQFASSGLKRTSLDTFTKTQ